jgi:hypothetical protein
VKAEEASANASLSILANSPFPNKSPMKPWKGDTE